MPLQGETLIKLTDTVDLFPVRVHVQTLYRWATHGVNGAVLETVRQGHYKLTSKEAVQRFLAAQAQGAK